MPRRNPLKSRVSVASRIASSGMSDEAARELASQSPQRSGLNCNQARSRACRAALQHVAIPSVVGSRLLKRCDALWQVRRTFSSLALAPCPLPLILGGRGTHSSLAAGAMAARPAPNMHPRTIPSTVGSRL